MMTRIGAHAGLVAAMLCMGSAIGHAQASSAPSDAEAPAAAEAMTLFALVYRPGPKWRAGKSFGEQIAIREHFLYMKALFAKGQIFSAGGMGTDQGLVLFHARSHAEAEAAAAADPMVQAGSFVAEVRPYSPAFLSDRPLTKTKI